MDGFGESPAFAELVATIILKPVIVTVPTVC